MGCQAEQARLHCDSGDRRLLRRRKSLVVYWHLLEGVLQLSRLNEIC